MAGKPSLWNYALTFRSRWFDTMSGGASVPFAFFAAFLDNKFAQAIFAAMAIICAWFAAYRAWKGERESVLELEKKLDPINIRAIEAQEAHVEALHAQTDELRRQNEYRNRESDPSIKMFREKRAAQGTLPDERQLSNVVLWIARNSAWGRWQYAQMGGHPNEFVKIRTVDWALQMEAETGELPIIGLRRGHVEPEPVSADLLKHVAYLHVEPNSMGVWKVSIRPRSGLDAETISKIPDYVSLEADWGRVQELWPEHDALADELTAKLIADKHNGG